jgi:hypothetical protein
MTRSSRFQFVDDLDHIAAETPGVVEVPAGITSKQQLMQEFITSLPLPEYFGGNWDALDECLRDRLMDDGPSDGKLLDEGPQPLCLLHRDLPLAQDEQDCCDYLTLLRDTLAWAEESATCEFTVIFSTDTVSAIERLAGWNNSS